MTLVLKDRVSHIRHGDALVRFGATILAFAAELRRRHRIGEALSRLSPRHLRDIDLTPNDVKSVCARPLAQDAATELYYVARLRGGNW